MSQSQNNFQAERVAGNANVKNDEAICHHSPFSRPRKSQKTDQKWGFCG